MNRKLFVILAMAITTAFMFVGSAHAEIVNTSADLKNNKKTVTYLYSQAMLKVMYQLGIEQDIKFGLQLDCKSRYRVEPIGVTVVSPIDFPDDKNNPTKGIWIFRYQRETCGESKVYNALFIANSNGEAPTPHAYYPGSTNAGPLLIKDAILSAIQVRPDGLKDCKDINVFDMRVTETAHDVVEGDKTFKGVWKEMWTFKMCGQLIDVPIRFTPDASGGGTSFKAYEAKFRETTAKP